LAPSVASSPLGLASPPLGLASLAPSPLGMAPPPLAPPLLLKKKSSCPACSGHPRLYGIAIIKIVDGRDEARP